MAGIAHVLVAVFLLLAASTSMSAAADNPLLGHWKLSGPGYVDRSGTSWCTGFPMLDFTATSQTIYTAAMKFRPAGQSTTSVHYLVAGNKVYVSSLASFYNAPSYLIVGPGKIMSQDVGHCPYQKQ